MIDTSHAETIYQRAIGCPHELVDNTMSGSHNKKSGSTSKSGTP